MHMGQKVHLNVNATHVHEFLSVVSRAGALPLVSEHHIEGRQPPLEGGLASHPICYA